MAREEVTVALLGGGTVGTSVVELRRTAGSALLFLDAFNEVKEALSA